MISERVTFENIFYVYRFNLYAKNTHVVTLKKVKFCFKPLNICAFQ